MRELHDGVDVLKEERDAGPFVWQNWDKWVGRCEEVVLWLDQQVLSGDDTFNQSYSARASQRGLICGVEWPVFRQTVEKYRKWLDQQYGGPRNIKEKLVFAHNDVSYKTSVRFNFGTLTGLDAIWKHSSP